MLTSISPIDGRYEKTTQVLSEYFSEYALIKYRVKVEIQYLKALSKVLPQLSGITASDINALEKILIDFSQEDAQNIKDIEKTTNHDVKAVEYFIKDKMSKTGLGPFIEFVHFGLTSQDINNTAFPMMIQDAKSNVILPHLSKLIEQITEMANQYKSQAMLARTHGQAASPTTLGKEIYVFVERLNILKSQLENQELFCKFGGATGNFNAHVVSYPSVDWKAFANEFIQNLGLKRYQTTTQIAHYDDHADLFHICSRINTVLIDYCRDIWTYVSMDYFKQKTVAGEVGSSAMPHKVNPIDFENAEGNAMYANSIFGFLADKLPVSRLQRDLTDSTVLRNVGVPFAHMLIALGSIYRGNNKLLVNVEKINQDLENNWAVVAEAIQNILRREAYPQPYEALKELTRGKAHITQNDISTFIDSLNISDLIKAELRAINPQNYVGYEY